MTMAALREKLRQVAPVVRRIIGAPDYDAYVAHATRCHADQPLLSRDEFVASRLADRYSRPGARCC
jgi:uncharacterized short protein YbdD (DUF466 family)